MRVSQGDEGADGGRLARPVHCHGAEAGRGGIQLIGDRVDNG